MRRSGSRFVIPLLAGLSLLVSVLAVPAAAAAPTAPTPALTPGDTTMAVTWAAGDPGAPATITSYDISIDPDPAGAGTVSKLATDSSHTFSGLTSGVSYTVTLTVNNDDPLSDSATASATTTTPAAAPDAPTGVGLTQPSPGTGAVTWTPGATNGSVVTGYTVTLIASSGGPAPAAASVSGAGTTTTSFSGLNPGTYTASVVTEGTPGPSAAGTGGSITVTQPALVPETPTNVDASVNGGAITVTFSSTVDGGADDASSYRIRLLTADGSVVQQVQRSNVQAGISTGDSTGTFTFTTGVSGEYSVDVAATNDAGTSAVATKSGLLVSIAPSVPLNLSSSSNGDQVTVNWAIPTTTGGAIDYYLVTVDGAETRVDAPTTEVVISGVAQGTHTPTVVALNTANLRSPAASNGTVNVVLPADAPVDVEATTEVQTVVVTWGAPANSGGSPVLSYRVTVDGVSKTVDGTTTTVTFTNVSLGNHVAMVVATTSAGAGAEASSPAFDVKRGFHPFDTDGGFVDQLYRDILGRTADSGGHAYWASIVGNDTANVPTVVKNFLASPEFGPREPIIRLYLAYFNRAPDAGGFDYWTDLYVDGEIDLAGASYYFSTSEEFNATYGSLSDGQFVVLVYNNVLGRSPDVDGYNHWVNQLSRGLSRSQLMIEFSESPEFLASSRNFVDITMVYRGMLDRIPSIAATTNEFNIWLPRLGGSEDIDDLIMDIFNGDEYADRVTP